MIILRSINKLSGLVLLLFYFSGIANTQTNYQLPTDFVLDEPIGETDFPIVSVDGSVSVISYDFSDYPGVIHAINDLQNDIDSVTGKRLSISTMKKPGEHWQNNNSDKVMMDNVRVDESVHKINKSGEHTLKFWVIDKGLILQKLVIDCGGVKPSESGPLESYISEK